MLVGRGGAGVGQVTDPIVRHHTICQGCGSDDSEVEAGGIYGCSNRHCLASGAWNGRMEAGYQDGDGKTSPAMALKWRGDLLADLMAAAEDGEPKRLAVMVRSARRVAKHLGEMIPGLADEIRVAEELTDGWDLAEVMREYHGADEFEARAMAGVTPDAMAAAALRKYAKGAHATWEALQMIGLTPEEMSERWPGLTTPEVAGALLAHYAGVIQDRERERKMGPR